MSFFLFFFLSLSLSFRRFLFSFFLISPQSASGSGVSLIFSSLGTYLVNDCPVNTISLPTLFMCLANITFLIRTGHRMDEETGICVTYNNVADDDEDGSEADEEE